MVGLVGCQLLDAFCELVVGGEEVEGGGDGGVVGGYGVGEGVEGGFDAVEAGLEEGVHFWVIIGRSRSARIKCQWMVASIRYVRTITYLTSFVKQKTILVDFSKEYIR